MSVNINNKKNNNLPSLNRNSNSAGKTNNKNLSQVKIKSNKNLNTNKKNMNHSNSQINLNSNKLSVKKKNTKSANNNKNTDTNNEQLIINSSLIDIDNIDESSYNPDPYTVPKKKFDHLYITKIEKAVNNYNEIKEIVNKKILDTQLPNNAQSLQIKNFSLLEQLDKLNTILDTLVERKRFTKKKDVIDSNENNFNKNKKEKEKENTKNKPTPKDINIKLLQSYKKQMDALSAKYEKIVKDDYIHNLKYEVDSISIEIANLEKTNRELQTNQFKNEFFLKSKNFSLNDLKYKKKLEEYDHFNNEYTRLMKKIPPVEENVKNNNVKIDLLNDNKNNLITIAKETYNIDNPEETIIYKIIEDKEKIKNERRKRELEKKIFETNTNLKKYNIKKKDNIKYIKQLQDEKNTFDNMLRKKREELVKLNEKLEKMELDNLNGDINNEANQISYKILNNNNNINKYNSSKKEDKIITNNNNISSSLENQISPIKSADINNNKIKIKKLMNNISHNDNNINNNIDSNQKLLQKKEKTIEIDLNNNNNNNNIIGNSIKVNNNRYNGSTTNLNNNNDLNNNKTYNKKMILEQLDIQNNQQNTMKIDKTINLKKNKLKPNFSFTLNDTNKKNKNVNLSVAIQPKTTISKEEQKESEGEIKEDIQINNNLNDENMDNKKEDEKMYVNLSQNISMDKMGKEEEENENGGEKIRENDLNTVPYNELDNGEKIINDNDNGNDNDKNIENDNYINSNEQEHIFENGDIKMDELQNDNINMD